MNATARPDCLKLLADLRAETDSMASLLAELVELESPSSEPSMQDDVRRRLAREFTSLGFLTRQVRGVGVGDHLLARPPDARRPIQLVLGHIDTVWPLGTTLHRPAARDGQRLSGPGSFDMKAGLVQLIFALKALELRDLEPPAAVTVFLNTDEEIGSPDSRRWITWLSQIAERAFVLEGAAGMGGDLKVGRKGVGRFKLRAKGLAAHAGLDPRSGASAILEISVQIQRVFELNDADKGITVNVGTVDGGLRPNVVAPEASAEIDVRVFTAADAEMVEAELRSLQPVDPAVKLEVEGGFGRPPMEATPGNQRLWERAARLADKLGLDLDSAIVGGASDGNLTSLYIPTLDGLGGVGDGAHREDEHVRLDAMPERAALLALLLMSPLQEEP